MRRFAPLTAIGRWASSATSASPFTNVYGAARSLLALATLCTLLFNSPSMLFRPAAGLPPPPYCGGISGITIYCVSPDLHLARVLSIIVLTVVVIGYRPRWTGIPHWYVTFSFHASATTTDGGDQVAAVLALLLVPVALCDGRRWHWQAPSPTPPSEVERSRRILAVIALTAIRVQAAVLYFHAGMSKFAVKEWADGTALYYWLNDSVFGAPPWLAWAFAPIFQHGNLLALFTWSMMAGEVVLAFALFAPKHLWKYFLAGAIAFHVGIALVIGLFTFAMAMIALDIIFLHPAAHPLRLPRLLQPRWRRAGDHSPAAEPASAQEAAAEAGPGR